MTQGAKAMGDHDGGPPGGQTFQDLDQIGLSAGIQRARWFVQDQDWSVSQKRAGPSRA